MSTVRVRVAELGTYQSRFCHVGRVLRVVRLRGVGYMNAAVGLQHTDHPQRQCGWAHGVASDHGVTGNVPPLRDVGTRLSNNDYVSLSGVCLHEG